jgi:hypothetical protein
MAQYDLHLYQNVHATGVEFSEKTVNITKGAILSANASQVPTVLPPGTDGYQLVRDDAEVTGLKWVPISGGHTQGTDTGTTSPTFQIDSGNTGPKLKNNALVLEARNAADAAYADFKAKDATFNKAYDAGSDPTADAQLANKQYVDKVLAANDAMLYKGTIGTGGTHTIAAFNALTTYNAGWTYRVIEAGTIRGNVCQIGDMITVLVDRSGSGNLDADFTAIQTNIDGAVVGPASATDNGIALFDGTTGKLLKSGSAVGTMAYETATNYVAKALFDANTILAANADNTPLALTVAEQTILGRKTGGNIGALTPAEAMNVLWVTAPAAKNSTGTAGQIAKDTNYLYVCTATDTWKRSILATNW